MKWQSNKESRYSIKLTPKEKQQLRRESKRLNVTMSNYIRTIINEANDSDIKDKAINKSEVLNVRLTDVEKQTLRKKAKNRNQTMSAFLCSRTKI
jgi:predicted DNA-binding protein